MSYTTIKEPSEFKDVIKASRFIAYLYKALTVEEAQAYLADIRKLHPDANHHCWAYRIGEVYRFSDDGEPGGTAGRPMVEVLNKRDIDRVMAIVVRYFGGTKLGAGGLIRAYAGTVAKALDNANLLEVLPMVLLEVEITFDLMDSVFRFLAERPVTKEEPNYTANGMQLRLTMQQGLEEEFLLALSELSKGQAKLISQKDLPLDS